MLKNDLAAFTSENSILSRKVIEEDNKINVCYKRILNELVKITIENHLITRIAIHLLFVAEHLKLIEDYVKNTCEPNVYLTETVLIKHSKIEKKKHNEITTEN
jgi:phosphate uptake regulator